jgi:UDP-2,3-diacylglucosamine pyrophosphatase LpxH
MQSSERTLGVFVNPPLESSTFGNLRSAEEQLGIATNKVVVITGNVDYSRTSIHELADGRRFLVIHGDEFDMVARHARWLALLGDWAYEAALALNAGFNRVRRLLGFEYRSFSAWAKLKVKNAVNSSVPLNLP